ncbi:MAG: DivIVA domain-containing protein [Pseudarcicella sp.]|nr:DivIVA domain-containing protein [Pseudarcicella sp.]MBP6409574.1 DivIVA domain-containing protein [Pseudarcicella sp.]
MKITAIEIRQQVFDKSFRGYDADSVNAFLMSLSQEWEKMMEEIMTLRNMLETSEKEVQRMKDIETTLFKTLKSAEQSQLQINEKAKREADMLVTSAKSEANYLLSQVAQEVQDKRNAIDSEISAIMDDAQKTSKIFISDAEIKAKYIVEEAENELKNFERDLNAMEQFKANMVEELKKFALDTLDKTTKFEHKEHGNLINQSIEKHSEVKAIEEAKVVIAPKEKPTDVVVEAAEKLHAKAIEKEVVLKSKIEEDTISSKVQQVKKKKIDTKIKEGHGLPTVRAVMDEIAKGNLIGEGSFFDEV